MAPIAASCETRLSRTSQPSLGAPTYYASALSRFLVPAGRVCELARHLFMSSFHFDANSHSSATAKPQLFVPTNSLVKLDRRPTHCQRCSVNRPDHAGGPFRVGQLRAAAIDEPAPCRSSRAATRTIRRCASAGLRGAGVGLRIRWSVRSSSRRGDQCVREDRGPRLGWSFLTESLRPLVDDPVRPVCFQRRGDTPGRLSAIVHSLMGGLTLWRGASEA